MSEKVTVFPDRRQEVETLAHAYWQSPEKDGYATVEEEIEEAYGMYTEAIRRKALQQDGLTLEGEEILWQSYSDYVFRDKPEKFIALIQDQLQL